MYELTKRRSQGEILSCDKKGHQKFGALKWEFFLKKGHSKIWSAKFFSRLPKLGAKSPPTLSTSKVVHLYAKRYDGWNPFELEGPSMKNNYCHNCSTSLLLKSF